MAFEIEVNQTQQYPIIILRNTASNCEAEVYAFGGLLNAFRLPVNGQAFNIIAGFSSVADAISTITNGFKSAKLAPFVCRMRDGKFDWQNRPHQIEKFYLGESAIHGIVYDAIYQIESTQTTDASAMVVLTHTYTGSDNGYPYSFELQVQWTLETGNKLTVTTNATNTSENAIPFADGWHPYFNLGSSVNECALQFNSNQQLEFDAHLLPSGNFITDTRFEKGTSLEGIALDNCFELDKKIQQPRCILSNKNLQLVIEPADSYPYLQIYIPDNRQSIAIENLSSAPDAFNNKMGLLILEPHQTKNFTTSYIITAS